MFGSCSSGCYLYSFIDKNEMSNRRNSNINYVCNKKYINLFHMIEFNASVAQERSIGSYVSGRD